MAVLLVEVTFPIVPDFPELGDVQSLLLPLLLLQKEPLGVQVVLRPVHAAPEELPKALVRAAEEKLKIPLVFVVPIAAESLALT